MVTFQGDLRDYRVSECWSSGPISFGAEESCLAPRQEFGVQIILCCLISSIYDMGKHLGSELVFFNNCKGPPEVGVRSRLASQSSDGMC